MNENHAVFGVLAVVLVIGLAGLYMTLQEPNYGPTGLDTLQSGTANNMWTLTLNINAISATITCNGQAPQPVTGTTELSTNTVIASGAITSFAGPADMAGAALVASAVGNFDDSAPEGDFECGATAADRAFEFEIESGPTVTISAALNGALTAPLNDGGDGVGIFSRAQTDQTGYVPDVSADNANNYIVLTGVPQTIGTNTANGARFYVWLNFINTDSDDYLYGDDFSIQVDITIA